MDVDFSSFQSVFQWVSVHSYLIIFLVMCAEGPITTAAAGFAAALGFFDPWIILALSISGDLVPDALYYLFGYKSRLSWIERMMHKVGFTQARMERLENMLKRHFRKTLLGMKFTPVIGPWGYMLIGYLRLSFLEFMAVCSAVTVPKSVIFLIVGYYFGHLYNINEYIHNISIFLPLVAVVLFAMYFIYTAIAKAVAKRTGKIA